MSTLTRTRPARSGFQNGTDYNELLKYADKLLVWGNYDLGGQPLGALINVAYYLTQYPPDRVILMIGLWDKNYSSDTPKEAMGAIPAEALSAALKAAAQGEINNLGVIPSFLMSNDHWKVLQETWGKPSS